MGTSKSPPVADVWAPGYVISLHSVWNVGWFPQHTDVCTHLQIAEAFFNVVTFSSVIFFIQLQNKISKLIVFAVKYQF